MKYSKITPPRVREVNGELGKSAEQRFAKGCAQMAREGHFPPWLYTVSKATPEEDAEGIDAWAHTDTGNIALQIKRSKDERTKFLRRENRKHIICIVVSPHTRFKTIFAFTLSQLMQERQRRLRAQT